MFHIHCNFTIFNSMLVARKNKNLFFTLSTDTIYKVIIYQVSDIITININIITMFHKIISSLTSGISTSPNNGANAPVVRSHDCPVHRLLQYLNAASSPFENIFM